MLVRNSIKIAIIEPVGGHGGMDYYDIGLLRGLVGANSSCYLYTCDETYPPRDLEDLVYRFYDGIYGSAPSWFRALKFMIGSIKSLFHAKYHGAEICHLHFFNIGILEFFNFLLSKILGMIVVITVHDVEPFVSSLSIPALSKILYRLSDKVIAHNRVSQEELTRVFLVSEKKIEIIPHGNYFHTIDNIPCQINSRARLELPLDAKILLFFGQIKEVKGLDILLRSLPGVVKKIPDLRLMIAGRVWKDDFNKYQRIIEDNGLKEYCILNIEYIPNEKVSDFFSAADLVILPYRKIYQSGTVLLAMSYGKPVLASDLAGMREVVKDGETGFLFPDGDVQKLSEKIIEILSEPDHCQIVAENALRLVKCDYGWEKIGHLTSRCYRSALNTG
jgi:D-inositol-3-phosphate glycosyltransferase